MMPDKEAIENIKQAYEEARERERKVYAANALEEARRILDSVPVSKWQQEELGESA